MHFVLVLVLFVFFTAEVMMVEVSAANCTEKIPGPICHDAYRSANCWTRCKKRHGASALFGPCLPEDAEVMIVEVNAANCTQDFFNLCRDGLPVGQCWNACKKAHGAAAQTAICLPNDDGSYRPAIFHCACQYKC